MSAPLHIVTLCHPTLGGSGVLATELALGLGRRGHQVHLLATGHPFRLPKDTPGVTLHTAASPSHPLFETRDDSLTLAAALISLCRDHPVDVIHGHYALPHGPGIMLARRALGPDAPPWALTLHGTDVTQLATERGYRELIRVAALDAGALTTPSAALAESAAAALDLDGPIEVVPNFVDTDRFTPLPAPRGRPPTVAHVSNFRPVKRSLDAVEAFAVVAAAHPTCRLILIGDGPERPAAEARLADLGLSHRAHVLQARPSVAPLLAEADVLLMTSCQESFGLAALEAMSCGLPVVGTQTGGLPELIQEGVTGHLVPVADIDGLARATLGLIEDAEARHQMGDAARRYALAHGQPGPVLDRYEAIYRRLAASTSQEKS